MGRDAAAVWEMVNDVEGNDLTATTETITREQIDAWCGSRPEQDERLDIAIIDNEMRVRSRAEKVRSGHPLPPP